MSGRDLLKLLIVPAGVLVAATFLFRTGHHPLEGEPAPPISLALSSGAILDLASHKGKDIVVLDFWATWCPPCRMSLPMLARVAADYSGKGVAVYAVNLQEQEAEVLQFLNDEKIDLVIAYDLTGSAAEAYFVSGIPQTVIIDKTGVVRIVHEGASPEYETVLRLELDGMLKGATN